MADVELVDPGSSVGCLATVGGQQINFEFRFLDAQGASTIDRIWPEDPSTAIP